MNNFGIYFIMESFNDLCKKITVVYETDEFEEKALSIASELHLDCFKFDDSNSKDDLLCLKVSANGIALALNDLEIFADLSNMISRLKKNNLQSELIVKAAKYSDTCNKVLDATAGMAEDSLLLAAAGFDVTLYERDPVIFVLVRDSLQRAANIPELADAVSRMNLVHGDSIYFMNHIKETSYRPDVILLDPMFPERHKSGLVKKKFQLLHLLEKPCNEESELLAAALFSCPKKIIIKRPLKGEFLAGRKPSYSLQGKAIRYDCIINIK